MPIDNRLPLPVKAVLLDLDGTLLDTITDLSHAANLMRVELGMSELPGDLVKTFVGKGIKNLVKRTLVVDVDREADTALMEKATTIFERHYAAVLTRSTTHYPGVMEGLEAMQDMGLRLGCVTNKPARFALPLLQEMGLSRFFEITLCGDSLPKKKPDPMPLLHAADFFDVGPEEVLLIGDSVNDFDAARAAGCRVFIVPYGYNEGRDVRELDPDAVVPGLVEAAQLIRNSSQ
jgi:phosphoglycolate phosphatase